MAGPWEDFQDDAQPASDDTPVEQQAAPAQNDGPWNDFQAASDGPWDDFKDKPDDSDTGESSAAGTFARDLAKQQGPLAGGLAGAGLGGTAGFMAAGPVGAFVGGVGGGLVGSFMASGIQDYILDKLGLKDTNFFSDEQARIDAKKHPWARRAADIVGAAEAFTGGPASGLQRLASGGINTAIEGGQQAYNGEFDPSDLAVKFATGAMLPNMRGGVPGKIFDAGASLAGRAKTSLPGQTAPSHGHGETPPPPAEDAPVGNETNNGARDGDMDFSKKATPSDTGTSLTQGEIKPDVEAALKEWEDVGNAQPPRPNPIKDMVNRMSDDDVVDASKQQREIAGTPRGNGLGEDPAQSEYETRQQAHDTRDFDGEAVDPRLAQAVRRHAQDLAEEVRNSVGPDHPVPPETMAEAVDVNVRAWAQKHGYDPEQFIELSKEYEARQQAHDTRDFDSEAVGRETPRAPEPDVTATVTPLEKTPTIEQADVAPPTGEMQEIGNKPGQRPDAAARPRAPGQKVLDQAITLAHERGQPKIAKVLMDLPPEQQALMATKYIRDVQALNPRRSTGAEPQVARVPSKAATADNGVTARTKGDAKRINQALKAADQAVAKFPPNRDYNPNKPEDVAALKQRLTNIVEAARAANRGQLPHESYQALAARGPGAKEPPAGWALVRAADRLLRNAPERTADNRYMKFPDKVTEFLAKEKMLRSGNPEDVRTATLNDRIDAGMKMSRRMGDDAVADAQTKEESKQVELERAPAEEGIGKETPIKTKDDLQAFEKGKDPTTASDDVLSKMIDKDGIEDAGNITGKWKDVVAKQGETVAEKMARQRAAREASGKKAAKAGEGYDDKAPVLSPKSVDNFLRDEGGSVKLPSFSQVPREAYKNLFGSKDDLAAKVIRKIFSPATVSKLSIMAAKVIREFGGLSARDLARVKASVEQFRRIMNEAPEADLKSIQYAIDEGDKTLADPKYHPLIDVLTPVFKDLRKKLEALPIAARMEFIENYFPHMYKNAAASEIKTFSDNYFMKQGNSSSTNERTIPTLREAEKMGFKLWSADPVEVTLRYASSMHAYIRSIEILEHAMKHDIVKQFDLTTGGGASGNPDNSIIPPGYAEIKGRTLDPYQKLYAPEDWAHVYNNYLDPGWKTTPVRGKIYDSLQKTSNAVTSLELGLSAFHAFTMAKEAMITDIDLGIKKMLGGDYAGGLKRVALFSTAPWRLYKIGSEVQKAYLGDTNIPPEVQKVEDYMTRAGGRMLGRAHDPSYSYSQMGSFVKAWEPTNYFRNTGALGRNFKDIGREVGSQFKDTRENIKDADGALKGWEAAKGAATFVGRFMQTAAAPLFEKYIPAIKAGAYYEHLAEYMKQNPDLSREEMLDASRKIGDSIDNRFGEMVQDNLFFSTMAKQSAQVAMRSWSWNLGTIREIGGGAASLLSDPSRLSMKSKDFDPRIGYVVAMPALVAATSMIYQFLKTGKGPGDQLDMMAPQTGGKNKYGTAERALMPGYEKDVFGYADDPIKEASNKLATAPRLFWETVTNKDYADMPLRNPQHGFGRQVMEWLKHVGGNLGPISVRQLTDKHFAGSNISSVERGAAIREAPAYLQNPRYIQGVRAKHDSRQWSQKVRRDLRNN